MSDVPTQICAFLAFCQSASRPPTVIMLILAPGVRGRVDIYNTLLYLSTVVEDTNEIMKLPMKAAQFVTFKGWWFYSLCEEGGRWPWVCNFFANWNPDNKIRGISETVFFAEDAFKTGTRITKYVAFQQQLIFLRVLFNCCPRSFFTAGIARVYVLKC